MALEHSSRWRKSDGARLLPIVAPEDYNRLQHGRLQDLMPELLYRLEYPDGGRPASGIYESVRHRDF